MANFTVRSHGVVLFLVLSFSALAEPSPPAKEICAKLLHQSYSFPVHRKRESNIVGGQKSYKSSLRISFHREEKDVRIRFEQDGVIPYELDSFAGEFRKYPFFFLVDDQNLEISYLQRDSVGGTDVRSTRMACDVTPKECLATLALATNISMWARDRSKGVERVAGECAVARFKEMAMQIRQRAPETFRAAE